MRTGEGLGWSHAQRRHPWGRTAHDWVQGWSVPNEELCLYPLGELRTGQRGEAWPENPKPGVGIGYSAICSQLRAAPGHAPGDATMFI